MTQLETYEETADPTAVLQTRLAESRRLAEHLEEDSRRLQRLGLVNLAAWGAGTSLIYLLEPMLTLWAEMVDLNARPPRVSFSSGLLLVPGAVVLALGLQLVQQQVRLRRRAEELQGEEVRLLRQGANLTTRRTADQLAPSLPEARRHVYLCAGLAAVSLVLFLLRVN